jgi:glutathione S-transferase
MSLTLYHVPPSRSSIALWMVEEIGQPYELKVLSINAGETRAPGYLAINPMGKVPALDHDGTIVTEAAAICAYLADTFPAARLAPPLGDKRRGPYLKWLFFGPGCLEPAIIDKMLERPAAPQRALGYGDHATLFDVLAKALATGPYLLGEHFTAADVVIGSGLRWGSWTKAVPERPELQAYLARLAERPALRRATKKDEELSAAQAAAQQR